MTRVAHPPVGVRAGSTPAMGAGSVTVKVWLWLTCSTRKGGVRWLMMRTRLKGDPVVNLSGSVSGLLETLRPSFGRVWAGGRWSGVSVEPVDAEELAGRVVRVINDDYQGTAEWWTSHGAVHVRFVDWLHGVRPVIVVPSGATPALACEWAAGVLSAACVDDAHVDAVRDALKGVPKSRTGSTPAKFSFTFAQ